MDQADFLAKYGPWALIAGASEGTGAAFARQLAAAGLNLILVARRDGPLDALAAEIKAAYPAAQIITATIDLAKKDAADRLAQVAEGREVGLLILNAGADPNGATFLENDIANWVDLTNRNVMTVLRACHHFARVMAPRGRGGMILVNSGACYMGLPGCSVYGATKAYDLVLGEALWAELAPHGIDVLNLVMGQTDTPAYRELMARKGIPFPTNTANPEDVAALGLARLPHGPTTNWAEADDTPGMTFSSAAQRRDRIRMIAAHSMKFGAKD
ncbi:MAG: SDR family NAD(P)-dependent oxidoreductase [Sphingomonadales bacterium]|nr:SDR family NAD(P)-dependent oxidoreductase [Sphingomonadales bacterium]